MDESEYGPLLLVTPDGTRVYQRGFSDSYGFVEANIGIFNFSSQFNPDTGDWEPAALSFVTLVGNGDLEVSPNGDLTEFSPSIGYGPFEVGFVISEDGTVRPMLGLGVGYTRNGNNFGFGAGVVLPNSSSDPGNFSRLNTVTVSGDGTVIYARHRPGDANFPHVRVDYTIVAPDGSVETGTTNIADAEFAQRVAAGLDVSTYNAFAQCFLAGTVISLSDGSTSSIEAIRPGDLVLSYNVLGTLAPGRVVRTFRNEVGHLLDVHGLRVTPGHMTLCGEGMFAGRHVPIIDILLSDGALVRADGSLVRIATNIPVGSLADRFVEVSFALTAEDAQATRLQTGRMRVGTLLFDRKGEPVSVLDCLEAGGYAFDPDTGLVAKPGELSAPLRWFGPLPRPEDYVLRRSRETLEGILTAGEWEGTPSELALGRLRQMQGRAN